jgi:hypothetical protein
MYAVNCASDNARARSALLHAVDLQPPLLHRNAPRRAISANDNEQKCFVSDSKSSLHTKCCSLQLRPSSSQCVLQHTEHSRRSCAASRPGAGGANNVDLSAYDALIRRSGAVSNMRRARPRKALPFSIGSCAASNSILTGRFEIAFLPITTSNIVKPNA